MPDYFVPSTKQELIRLIKEHYHHKGQTCQGLEGKSKKNLYAIFYSIREKEMNNV